MSSRRAQNISRERAKALDEKTLDDYFKLIEEKINELDLKHQPSHLWNVDETGFNGEQGNVLVNSVVGFKHITIYKI